MKTSLILSAVLLCPWAAASADDVRTSVTPVTQAESAAADKAEPADAEEREESQQLVQEVFQTELVYPQEKGEVQVTAAVNWNEEQDGRTKEVPLSLEYGLTDAWQIEMSLTGVDRRFEGGDSSQGVGDLEVGTKYSFMNIGGRPLHAAVGVEVTLPVGDPDQGLGEGLLQVEPFVAVGRDFPELNRMHVFGQVGLGLVRRTRGGDDEGQPAHELSVNTGLLVPVQNFRLVAELNWASNRWNHDGDETSLFVTPGVVWDLPGTWELGVGVPIGLMNEGDRYRVITQLIYEFGGH
ncbi:MAG: hypothetical protein ABI779_05580 [Acidobacteriota bacterium]